MKVDDEGTAANKKSTTAKVMGFAHCVIESDAATVVDDCSYWCCPLIWEAWRHLFGNIVRLLLASTGSLAPFLISSPCAAVTLWLVL
eukprot:gene17971-20829_t